MNDSVKNIWVTENTDADFAILSLAPTEMQMLQADKTYSST